MFTLEDQIAWEESMSTRGAQRFRSQQDAAKETRAHETSAGSRLLRSYVLTISERIRLYLDGKHPDGRRRTKYAKLLDVIDTDKVALIALRNVIGAVFDSGTSLPKICRTIGQQCEDELRLTQFHTTHKEYYESLIRDFERKNVSSYTHKRRVLNAKGADKGEHWKNWPELECIGVGALVISLVMEVCNLIERKDDPSKANKRRKARANIVPTQACMDWIAAHEDMAELTNPDRMPCLIPPADWKSVTDGGFWSPSLRSRTQLIKARTLTKEKKVMYAEADMPLVLSAVNSMQSTAWQVNSRVHAVMQEVWAKSLGCGMPRSEPYEFPECPLPPEMDATLLVEGSHAAEAFTEWKAVTRELHTMEKERISKNLALIRTMRIARELADKPRFWYVYQCDFRGRVYAASSGLTPQGTDQSKGLIQFSKGEPLNDDNGVKWFLINGANKYGYDKASYEDRVSWTRENSQRIIETASNPISNRSFWAEADKPYQFLAWVFEYADFIKEENKHEYHSKIPVGLDGSCNGLQHFSAMLSDKVGGSSVNLLPADKPADIYQDVADVLFGKLVARAKDGEAAAINWLRALPDNKVPRKLTKKPVMTLPYGSTQQACTTSIYAYIMEYCPEGFDKNARFKHAIWLSPLLWASISEVVIAARAAMKWIQDSAAILAKGNHPMKYYSPIGFPVLQASHSVVVRQIETQIGGRLQLRIATSGDGIDVRKQRQGSSPNLVHHVDACHMMMVINACAEDGVTDFAMIHDDFGCHPRHAECLQRHIREQFVALHTQCRVIEDFKTVHEQAYGVELPTLPARGDLELEGVLSSDYFFG